MCNNFSSSPYHEGTAISALLELPEIDPKLCIPASSAGKAPLGDNPPSGVSSSAIQAAQQRLSLIDMRARNRASQKFMAIDCSTALQSYCSSGISLISSSLTFG